VMNSLRPHNISSVRGDLPSLDSVETNAFQLNVCLACFQMADEDDLIVMKEGWHLLIAVEISTNTH